MFHVIRETSMSVGVSRILTYFLFLLTSLGSKVALILACPGWLLSQTDATFSQKTQNEALRAVVSEWETRGPMIQKHLKYYSSSQIDRHSVGNKKYCCIVCICNVHRGHKLLGFCLCYPSGTILYCALAGSYKIFFIKY